MVTEGNFEWWTHNAVYRWSIIEAHTWKLRDFINHATPINLILFLKKVKVTGFSFSIYKEHSRNSGEMRLSTAIKAAGTIICDTIRVTLESILNNILTINATVSLLGLLPRLFLRVTEDGYLWPIPVRCPPNPRPLQPGHTAWPQLAALLVVGCSHTTHARKWYISHF